MSAVSTRMILQPAPCGPGTPESLVARARDAFGAAHVRRCQAAQARDPQIIADWAAAARPASGALLHDLAPAAATAGLSETPGGSSPVSIAVWPQLSGRPERVDG